MDSTDKVVNFVEECRSLGLSVAPPHVNECVYRFSVADERSVRYGLGAIKGVGESALEGIVGERVRNGHYVDLFDFTRRIDSKRVNRRVVEALVRAGALDGLGPSRASMMLTLNGCPARGGATRARYLDRPERHVRQRASRGRCRVSIQGGERVVGG